MCWNHRVVKRRDEVMKEDYYEIVEAFYWNKKNKSRKPSKKPTAFTEDGIRPMGESLKDLKWALKMMLKAVNQAEKDPSFLLNDTKKKEK